MSPESVSAPNTDPRRDAQLSLARAGGTWDVLIIGGGATGLGAAVDAAARGYRTLLVEKTDFGKGTSSRATKLAHGGVRYLAQGNISLVFNALHERGRMFRNAPHLAHPLPLVVPAYTWWSQPFYGPGLLFYSVLAGKLGDKPYLTGDAFSIADAYAYVMLAWANMFKLDLPEKLQTYFVRMRARPGVQQALKEEGLPTG